MQAVIFCGTQATGKSSFYRERFFRTHVRLSLDLLRTRHRERLLLQACLEARQPFVIDNTNPTRRDRARYVEPARAAGFRVIGYYFDAPLEAALRRNAARAPSERVPIAGIRGTYKRFEAPTPAEGFDELFCVTIGESGGFLVREWSGVPE
jgi:predicted kinase